MWLEKRNSKGKILKYDYWKKEFSWQKPKLVDSQGKRQECCCISQYFDMTNDASKLPKHNPERKPCKSGEAHSLPILITITKGSRVTTALKLQTLKELQTIKSRKSVKQKKMITK